MYAQILKIVAQRSTCNKPNSALIIKDGRIISMGYNGSPKGQEHCLDHGCEQGPDGGCIRTIHAEQNAIAFAAKYGISTEGAVLWCTTSPCVPCAKLIINSGIVEVVYLDQYRIQDGFILLRKANIMAHQVFGV